MESWISDLGDQNYILVSTVEELEKEANTRVTLLQERLDKMASVTKDSSLAIKDRQEEVSRHQHNFIYCFLIFRTKFFLNINLINTDLNFFFIILLTIFLIFFLAFDLISLDLHLL